MKLATSYFAQLRNFKPHMIPISTAIWQPKYFFKNGRPFFDKNNVINGLVYDELAPKGICEGLCHGPHECPTHDPNKCLFLKAYSKHIQDTVNIEDFCNRCNKIAEKVRTINHFEGEPLFVLMVYEKYDNGCSERKAIQNLFQGYGFECNELKYPIKENY